MPYLHHMAAKTHSGSFPLQQMQMAAQQQQQAAKYVQSTGQLDLAAQTPLQSIASQQAKKGRAKHSLREKEQLYEDAIKLKIQANSFKEENLKLKTKIKILENEMAKKEKALEDFIQKMTIAGASMTNPASTSYTGVFYPQPQAQ